MSVAVMILFSIVVPIIVVVAAHALPARIRRRRKTGIGVTVRRPTEHTATVTHVIRYEPRPPQPLPIRGLIVMRTREGLPHVYPFILNGQSTAMLNVHLPEHVERIDRVDFAWEPKP